MKIIIVVLLVLMGVGMLVLAPLVNRYVGETTFGVKLPQPTGSTQPAQEHRTTTTFARFMQVAGGLLMLAGLVVGVVWRSSDQQS
jgi:hypothetical protein